jgi:hypothetical protein
MSDITALVEAIGREGPERVDVVERRHLADFLAAVDEESPGSIDDEVPPTFLACFLDEPPSLPEAWDYGAGWLNGGDRFEYLRPVHVGDTLRSRIRLTEVQEKHGRTGTLAILTFVTEFRLPDDSVAVRHVGTRIRR